MRLAILFLMIAGALLPAVSQARQPLLLDMAAVVDSALEAVQLEEQVAPASTPSEAPTKAVFKLSDQPPPGFEDLSGPQTTQADMYFGGEFLASVYVEYDPYSVQISDPLGAVQLIPNLKDPQYVAQVLSGPLDPNADALCTATQRVDCGSLTPGIAAVIFDEGRFRLDLFVHPDQLLVHRVVKERYLQAPEQRLTTLHNLRMTASGAHGQRTFAATSESFVAHGAQRLRARYGLSNQGFSLYGASWQKDRNDMEFEAGSFRTTGRNLAFAGEVDLLGVRVATSTKTRTDLDQALATPVLLFLGQRSRVDVFRGEEYIDTQYYSAGNHELDTSTLPDGAYEIRLVIEDLSGAQREETHFFVRSGQMPPADQPQYYVEGGAILDQQEAGIPSVGQGAWLRVGSSHRLRDDLAWDNELLHANGQTVAQTGVIWLRRNWQLYAGSIFGSGGAAGVSLRGGARWRNVNASVDFAHVQASPDSVRLNEYSITRGGYTQGSASIGVAIPKGHLFLRGRLSEQGNLRQTNFGLSYFGSLFNRRGVSADLVVDAGQGFGGNWVRAGVRVRWQRGKQVISADPRVRFGQQQVNGAELAASWNGEVDYPQVRGFDVGPVNQTAFVEHDASRSIAGLRLRPQRYRQADLEIGYNSSPDNTGSLYYSARHRMSVATSAGHTTVGDGGDHAGALVVNIQGELEQRFSVLVNNRVVGHVRAGTPNVISLRPYEAYKVKISPDGDALVGYDQSIRTITLFPGTVQTLNFEAAPIVVMIGQLIDQQGNPLANARFENVEGFATTDLSGWFQIEVAHNEPLIMRLQGDQYCRVDLPDYEVADGLAMLDTLTCRSTQGRQ